MPTPQGRYWLVTLSCAYVPEQPVLTAPIVYIKGQKEIGEGGFEHWQILVITSKRVSRNQVKQALHETAHVELSRSEAANDYVWKEDTRVANTQFEIGNKPLSRARTTDWDAILSSAKRGAFEDIPSDIYIRNYSSLKRIRVDAMENVPRPDISAKVFIGPSGVGKTRLAWEQAGNDAYIKNPNTKWWDGYRGQANVIIDEFVGRIDISYLLTWLDRYPCTVEVKGYSMPLTANNFWITSNLTIEEWYPEAKQVHLEALKRRVNIEYIETLSG